MSTHTVSDAAARSGFSASSLRYYDDIGLVRPTSRTEAGYRSYDSRDLERLRFVARAKQLGCTLDEIRVLVEAWDGGHCAPVQHGLHDAVTEKLTDVEARRRELAALEVQLRRAAAELAAAPTDGPCDDRCACHARPDPVAPPIVCTLGETEIVDRIDEWQALLAGVTSRSVTSTGAFRVELGRPGDLTALARLVAAEQQCCSFMAFAITVDGRGVGLEVGAPDGAEAAVTAILGPPDSRGEG